MITDYINRLGLNLAPTPNAPVKVLVRRPFFVGGREVRIGDEIKLPRHDAISLQAIGKVQILEV